MNISGNNSLNWIKFALVSIVVCLTFTRSFGQVDSTNKFRPIGLKNDKVFIDYFTKFKLFVKNDDKNAIEKLLIKSYPILKVAINKTNGKKHETESIRVTNKQTFFKLYPKLFDKRMKEVIAKQDINDLKINYMGVMLHRGQIWWRYDTKTKTIIISSISNFDLIFP